MAADHEDVLLCKVEVEVAKEEKRVI